MSTVAKGEDYTKIDGIYRRGPLIVMPRPSGEFLAGAYETFRQDGLLESIFYEGVPSVWWFVNEFTQPSNYTLACIEQSLGQDVKASFCGLGWVNKTVSSYSGYRRAEVGIAFLKSKRRDVLRFGRMLVDHIFENEEIDCLFGTTPEPNRAAWLYVKRLGFTLSGPIPNFAVWESQPCGAIISSLSRRDWQKSRAGQQ